jgi:hypothetical protein
MHADSVLLILYTEVLFRIMKILHTFQTQHCNVLAFKIFHGLRIKPLFYSEMSVCLYSKTAC